MPADLTKPFDEACCDGGASNYPKSAQSCGCDEGANWVCERHKGERTTRGHILDEPDCKLDLTRDASPKPEIGYSIYKALNPLEDHLHEVVNKTWNFAGRLKTPQDHLSNAVMGLAAEAAEVLDEHKKLFFHTPKNRSEEILQELGDVMYYLAKVLELHSLTMNECLAANKKKLFERHGVKDGK